jgi:hypothetical protein
MHGLDGSRMHSRVRGRQALEKSLLGLFRRVHRFGTVRAQPGSADFRWAVHVCSQLHPLLNSQFTGETPMKKTIIPPSKVDGSAPVGAQHQSAPNKLAPLAGDKVTLGAGSNTTAIPAPVGPSVSSKE